MKFKIYPKNDVYSETTILEENNNYSVYRLSDRAESFVNRCPRKDSKYWGYKYVIWDIRNNCLAI